MASILVLVTPGGLSACSDCSNAPISSSAAMKKLSAPDQSRAKQRYFWSPYVGQAQHAVVRELATARQKVELPTEGPKQEWSRLLGGT
jgi:hypothetical protein